MTRLRILADDLTGALDTAAAFAGEVPVFIDRPPATDSPYRNATVSVVATPTRDVPPTTLPEHLTPTLDWFVSGDLAYKKVDSLLRGNTFAEIGWLRDAGKFPGVIFAPAFPGQGRLTADNRQWVAKPGQPPEAVAHPLREAFTAFGMTVATTLADRLDDNAVWIPEIRTDAELDTIATRLDTPALRHALWSGSAGLAQAIARHEGLTPQPGTPPTSATIDGPTVLISASFQPVLYAQWEALKAVAPTPAIAERARPDEIATALTLAQEGAADVRFDLSPRRDMTQTESLALLQQNVERIVTGLPAPKQLMIVGGDTLLAICRATGADALLAGASIQNGWGRATLVGGRWHGTHCHSRSGAFGGPDDLIQMMQRLRRDTNFEKGK
ncbi:four-carbon acid sugar kinase family protein [uncultured Propionivibrio sp.]|uniref:four-carbon acid sugar kinase family protein n=1 Tax=uncultured Propionivibrio sp. TaxID=426737 RepID=UPI0029C0C84F|nr:four-carbon acid sugar kinase family protein [uncultured Propionivibrio sp.]